jgi:hypothetical protein
MANAFLANLEQLIFKLFWGAWISLVVPPSTAILASLFTVGSDPSSVAQPGVLLSRTKTFHKIEK